MIEAQTYTEGKQPFAIYLVSWSLLSYNANNTVNVLIKDDNQLTIHIRCTYNMLIIYTWHNLRPCKSFKLDTAYTSKFYITFDTVPTSNITFHLTLDTTYASGFPSDVSLHQVQRIAPSWSLSQRSGCFLSVPSYPAWLPELTSILHCYLYVIPVKQKQILISKSFNFKKCDF